MMNKTTEQKIAQLACWKSTVDIEPLSGGMTNLNFKVTDGADKYVVRLGSDDPIHLISRANERATCEAAFEAGLSPELVHAEPGVLVVRFVEGLVFQEADVRKPSNLIRITQLLREFHKKIPQNFQQIPVMFWVFQVLRHYQNLLQQGNSPYRNRLAELESIATTLEKAVGKIKIVFGHNDLLAANFIDDGEKIWLIDFDYAGFNSPLFDLSNLASNNEFSVDQEVTMLETYFDAFLNLRQWRSYYAMKCASLLRETLWSMVSETHSNLDIDFADYTRKNLARFEQSFDAFQREYL
ncbi:MAG: thiamine kinase-like enzyme [Gammaproteobacteria bacterium]|jgi:thiamine kinase-like enzyme